MKIISLMPSKCQACGESIGSRKRKKYKKAVFFFLPNYFIKI
jgi:hypothetical protein